MNHPKREKTLILIKPDGIQRGLIGEIISRLERVGLKLVALKIFIATPQQIRQQYGPNREEIEALGKRSLEAQAKLGRKIAQPSYEQGKEIVGKLEKFMSSGPVVAMVLEGNQAVGVVRKLVGVAEPLSSDVGTIRGDFTLDSYELADLDGRAVRNLVHCSGSVQEAAREIGIWFREEEILRYELIPGKVLYEPDLDGILK